jgi:hypothetical protein
LGGRSRSIGPLLTRRYVIGHFAVVFPSPTDLASYKEHFDVLMEAFGPERLIWGATGP